ncbi:transposase, partial [Bifidobacterium longum]|uniref:transposase n=1 Tax=Bifidobacterium longum TaxID=216816 RepID=UPI00298FE6E3
MVESRSSYSSETNAIAAVAKDLEVSPETLRRWRNQSDATVSAESKRSDEDAMAEFIGMLDDYMCSCSMFFQQVRQRLVVPERLRTLD